MVTTLNEVETYRPAYEAQLSKNGTTTTVLSALRERGFASFAETGLPTARKGNERWKYTNIGPIAAGGFKPVSGELPALSQEDLKRVAAFDERWTTMVFVDGQYSSDLSSMPEIGGSHIVTLAEALSDLTRPIGKATETHLGTLADPTDDDGFVSLNTAFFLDGAAVHFTGEAPKGHAVHLVFVSTEAAEDSTISPRVLVVADRFSKGTIIESHVSTSDARYFNNPVVEMVVEEGASLIHFRTTRESDAAFHIGTTRVVQQKDSVFKSISYAFGASLGRNDAHVLIDGPGADCTLNGLYMTSGDEHLDNHISTTHAKPHGSSHQLFKGILTGDSRAVFSGQVLVEQDAQKTFAEQRDMNLLLSGAAELDTKPSLLIYADDVQCFHGAAAGDIDEESLFYAMSRGLERETASDMLIRAFAGEIVGQAGIPAFEDYLYGIVDDLLPGFKM